MVFTALCNYVVTKLVIKFKIPETNPVIFYYTIWPVFYRRRRRLNDEGNTFHTCRSNHSEVHPNPPAWLKFKRLTIPSVD